MDVERQPEDGPNWLGVPERPSALNPLALPSPLTNRQRFYIFGIQGFGAACIDAAANFGIACAMYRTCHAPCRISMWNINHNTIAGDVGVTVFIGIATYVISSAMVHVDLRLLKIDPFLYPWPDTAFGIVRFQGALKPETRHGRLWQAFHNHYGLGRGLHFFSGTHAQDLFDFSQPLRVTFNRFVTSVIKGAVLSVLYFLVLWPITIAIIAPIWGGDDLAGTWVAPGIKAIFGFTLGLLMTPVVACIALGSEDAIRLHLREFQKLQLGMTGAHMSKAERVAPRPGDFASPPRSPAEKARHAAGGGPRFSLDEKMPATPPPARHRPLTTDVAMLRRSLDGGPRPYVPAIDGHRRKRSNGESISTPRSSVDGSGTSRQVSGPTSPGSPLAPAA